MYKKGGAPVLAAQTRESGKKWASFSEKREHKHPELLAQRGFSTGTGAAQLLRAEQRTQATVLHSVSADVHAIRRQGPALAGLDAETRDAAAAARQQRDIPDIPGLPTILTLRVRVFCQLTQ